MRKILNIVTLILIGANIAINLINKNIPAILGWIVAIIYLICEILGEK